MRSKACIAIGTLVAAAAIVWYFERPKARLHREAERVRAEMDSAANGSMRVHKVTQAPEEDLMIEFQCPDRVHLTSQRIASKEEIILADDTYVRVPDGRWKKAPGWKDPAVMSCDEIRRNYGAALLREPYSYYDVRDLGDSSSRGEPCHKWRLSPPDTGFFVDPRSDLDVCISPAHRLLSFDMEHYGVIEFYGFGASLRIEQPAPENTY